MDSYLTVSAHIFPEVDHALIVDVWSLATDGVFAAGITMLRVPIGATDFSDGREHTIFYVWPSQWLNPFNWMFSSMSVWNYDPTSGDTSLASFSVGNVPSYYFTVLADIASVNSVLKIMLCPWSPVRLRGLFGGLIVD